MTGHRQRDAGALGPPPLGALFSVARSGSTWLGAIVDSHPDVAYRFEPFNRLTDDAAITAWDRGTQAALADPLWDLYRTLRRGRSAPTKPPFFPKRAGHHRGRAALWPIARSVPLFDRAYERWYTPPGRPIVVFKQIGRQPAMDRLLATGAVPVVYLVRHPCGAARSADEGQRQGLMPTGQVGVLEHLLRERDPALAERFAGRLGGMSLLQKNALLWRLNVEASLAAIDRGGRGLVLTYENLCRDPVGNARLVLDHLGLGWHRQTEAFLDGHAGHRPRTGSSSKPGYFSIDRDPAQTVDRWADLMDAEQQRQVIDLVKDSPAVQRCAALGHWRLF